MRRDSLDRIAPLLEVLRAHPSLQESRPGEFFLDGKGFLHFHDGPDGVVADALLASGRVHIDVSDPSGQQELLDRIDRNLSSLERRARDRRRRSHGRRGGPKGITGGARDGDADG